MTVLVIAFPYHSDGWPHCLYINTSWLPLLLSEIKLGSILYYTLLSWIPWFHQRKLDKNATLSRSIFEKTRSQRITMKLMDLQCLYPIFSPVTTCPQNLSINYILTALCHWPGFPSVEWGSREVWLMLSVYFPAGRSCGCKWIWLIATTGSWYSLPLAGSCQLTNQHAATLADHMPMMYHFESGYK